jgi:tetratricopeptide (TPR) repeat protein
MAARAGIMTGEAAVGPGGNETGLVLGDIVNTASRLQSIGKPGHVLVGPTAEALTNRAILYTSIGEQSLKGKEETINVFKAERILAERGGVGRADVIEAPFVGRDEELRLLKDQLHAATRERRARLVSIVGQAGIGKSRLVWEFEKYIDGLVEDVYWHHGRAPSYSDGLAMWAIAEMVRGRCKITETEEPEVTRALLGDTLAEFLQPEERSWVEPQLVALLGLQQAGGERSEMHAAIRLFFERISQRDTTVLIFEDLHWADAATLDFVEELADWSRDFPILVVALARPDLLESRAEWGSLQRGVISMHLPPLADSDMHTLVGSLIPSIDEAARSNIVQPAGGIPLFAIEMVRMLLNDGSLAPQPDGTFEPTTDISGLAVPESISAVIGARLDRLDPSDRQIVQDASVLGQTFTVDALARISEMSEEGLSGRLTSLTRRELFELIRDPRSPERGQYGFVQSLIREVAHGRMSKEVRRAKHIEVAEYFGSLDGEDLTGVVANHYLEAIGLGSSEGDLLAATAAALAGAVRRAGEVHSYDQIVSLTNRAEGIISDKALLAPLWAVAADAAGALGRGEVAEGFAQRLVAHARESGDEAETALALSVWGEVLNDSGHSVKAVEVLEPHFDPTADLPETEGHARFAASLARARLLTGTEGAIEAAGQALIVADRLELEQVAAEALITKGTRLTDVRRPREGRALIAKAVEIAREHGLTKPLMRGIANSAYSAPTFIEGHKWNTLGLEEARRVGDRRMIQFFAHQRSGLLASQGAVDELEGLVNDPAIGTDDLVTYAQLRASIAHAHHVHGRVAEARAALDEALELREEFDDVQSLANLNSADIGLTTLQGDVESGYERAMAQHRESPLTLYPNIWGAWLPCLLGGRSERVKEFLAIAAEMSATSALNPYRDAGRAVAAALAGDASGALALATEASDMLRKAIIGDDARLLAAIVASHLPEDTAERTKLAELALSDAGLPELPGVTHYVERILAGDYQDAR